MGIEVAFTVFWAGRVGKASRKSPDLGSEKVGPVFPPNVSRNLPGTHLSEPSQPATWGPWPLPERPAWLGGGLEGRRSGGRWVMGGGARVQQGWVARWRVGLRASKRQCLRATGRGKWGPSAGVRGICSGERPLPGMSRLTSLLRPQVGPALGPVSGDASGRGSSSPLG